MSVVHNEASTQKGGHNSHQGFPWQYVIGYILSLVLTIAALCMVLNHTMHPSPLAVVIVLLAAAQIFVQLYMFMHITESDGPNYHSLAIWVGLVFTVAIVFGSIWIMHFSAQVA